MKRDPFERLRAANPVPPCTPPPIDGLWRRLDRDTGNNDAVSAGGGRVRGWVSRGLVAVPGLVASAVAIAVIVIALTMVGHTGTTRHTPGHSGPVGYGGLPFSPALFRAARQATRNDPACRTVGTRPAPAVSYDLPNRNVLSFLSVLRQPRTAADHLAPQVYSPAPRPVFVNYIRRARTVHGATYYVIPAGTLRLFVGVHCSADIIAAARHVLPRTSATQRAATIRVLESQLARLKRLAKQPSYGSICLLALAGHTQGTECVNASEIQRHGMFAYQPRGARGALVGGGAYLAGLVPDGVVTVTLHFQGPAPAPPVNVINNVFVVHVPRADVGPTSMIWHSASGTTIKTIIEPSSGGGLSSGFGQQPGP